MVIKKKEQMEEELKFTRRHLCPNMSLAKEKKEFNLSEKIYGEVVNDKDREFVFKEDIKEFIQRDTKLIKMFFDGKIGFRTLCLKRNKLAGDKLI